jgi:hypothetical protein
MTAGHRDELVQSLALLLLGDSQVTLAKNSEKFRRRLLAYFVLHRLPPELRDIPLRQRYAFGHKTDESTRTILLIVALSRPDRPFDFFASSQSLEPFRRNPSDTPIGAGQLPAEVHVEESILANFGTEEKGHVA